MYKCKRTNLVWNCWNVCTMEGIRNRFSQPPVVITQCVCLLCRYINVSHWYVSERHWFWYNHLPILVLLPLLPLFLLLFWLHLAATMATMEAVCYAYMFFIQYKCCLFIFWYQVAIKYYWWDEFVYRIQNEYQQLWVNGIPFNMDIDFMHTHTHTQKYFNRHRLVFLHHALCCNRASEYIAARIKCSFHGFATALQLNSFIPHFIKTKLISLATLC